MVVQVLLATQAVLILAVLLVQTVVEILYIQNAQIVMVQEDADTVVVEVLAFYQDIQKHVLSVMEVVGVKSVMGEVNYNTDSLWTTIKS